MQALTLNLPPHRYSKYDIIPILVSLAIANIDEIWSKNKQVESPGEKMGRPKWLSQFDVVN